MDQQAGVVVMQADIIDAARVDQGEQAGQPIDERLAADQPDIGPGPGLGGKMLAGTEADFEPQGARRGVEQAGRVEPRLKLDAQLWKQLVDQPLAIRA